MTISSCFSEVNYLYNISSIKNIDSILNYGLLSKNLILQKSIKYDDISNLSVQNRRENIQLDNSLFLHDFVNLYFNPRNAMLYYLINNKDFLNKLCIFEINKGVLDLDNTIVTNQNAAVTAGTRFMSPLEALNTSALDFKTIYKENWNSPNILEKDRIRKLMMAEVLVLNKIPPQYIEGIIVPNDTVMNFINKQDINIPIKINQKIFFNK